MKNYIQIFLKLRADTSGAEKRLGVIGSHIFGIGQQSEAARIHVERLYSSMRKLTTLPLRNYARGMTQVLGIGTLLGFGPAVAGGLISGYLAKGVWSTGVQFSKIRKQLEQFYGDPKIADMALKKVSAFAPRSPATMADISESVAIAKRSGIETVFDNKNRMAIMSDFASAYSRTMKDLALALEDVHSSNAWRRMNEGFGIRYETLARIYGKPELLDADYRKANADEVIDVIFKYMESKSKGLGEKMMETAIGAFSNFQDSMTRMFGEIFLKIEPGITRFLNNITKFVQKIHQNLLSGTGLDSFVEWLGSDKLAAQLEAMFDKVVEYSKYAFEWVKKDGIPFLFAMRDLGRELVRVTDAVSRLAALFAVITKLARGLSDAIGEMRGDPNAKSGPMGKMLVSLGIGLPILFASLKIIDMIRGMLSSGAQGLVYKGLAALAGYAAYKHATNIPRDAQGNPVDQGAVEGRSAGGPVDPRTPYVVGEKGPELFVPKSHGTIIPNNELDPDYIRGLNRVLNADKDSLYALGGKMSDDIRFRMLMRKHGILDRRFAARAEKLAARGLGRRISLGRLMVNIVGDLLKEKTINPWLRPLKSGSKATWTYLKSDLMRDVWYTISQSFRSVLGKPYSATTGLLKRGAELGWEGLGRAGFMYQNPPRLTVKGAISGLSRLGKFVTSDVWDRTIAQSFRSVFGGDDAIQWKAARGFGKLFNPFIKARSLYKSGQRGFFGALEKTITTSFKNVFTGSGSIQNQARILLARVPASTRGYLQSTLKASGDYEQLIRAYHHPAEFPRAHDFGLRTLERSPSSKYDITKGLADFASRERILSSIKAGGKNYNLPSAEMVESRARMYEQKMQAVLRHEAEKQARLNLRMARELFYKRKAGSKRQFDALTRAQQNAAYRTLPPYELKRIFGESLEKRRLSGLLRAMSRQNVAEMDAEMARVGTWNYPPSSPVAGREAGKLGLWGRIARARRVAAINRAWRNAPPTQYDILTGSVRGATGGAAGSAAKASRGGRVPPGVAGAADDVVGGTAKAASSLNLKNIWTFLKKGGWKTPASIIGALATDWLVSKHTQKVMDKYLKGGKASWLDRIGLAAGYMAQDAITGAGIGSTLGLIGGMIGGPFGSTIGGVGLGLIGGILGAGVGLSRGLMAPDILKEKAYQFKRAQDMERMAAEMTRKNNQKRANAIARGTVTNLAAYTDTGIGTTPQTAKRPGLSDTISEAAYAPWGGFPGGPMLARELTMGDLARVAQMTRSKMIDAGWGEKGFGTFSVNLHASAGSAMDKYIYNTVQERVIQSLEQSKDVLI